MALRVRGRILMMTLLGVAALAAALGLLQLWCECFSDEPFIKTMLSLLVLGVLSSFLIAVDYDLPSHRSRWYLYGLAGVAIAAALTFEAQLWFSAFGESVFYKLLLTYLIVAALLGFFLVAGEDLSRTKDLRDKNYID